MSRTPAAAALLLGALAACRSVAPAKPQTASRPAPAPAPAEAAAATQQDALQDFRDGVDTLLLSAENAAVSDEPEEFRDCEALVYQALARSPELSADAGDFNAYAADVMDELRQLGEQLDEDEEDTEEPPPEPQPVPEARVAEAQAEASRERFDLPVIVNPEVTSLIDFYTGRYRDRLIAALERASHYLPFIRAELTRAKLPADLAYLPLVESAFNPKARSRARAQGLWQFVTGTARLYDLHCDGLVDERNDPYLATQAAVHHLADLYASFNSWELALAAYNSGAGRVQHAIQRARGETDFWKIRRFLPRETRNYVPAMWAALVVTRNPGAYGLPVFEDKPLCLARVPVEGALDLEVLAERGKLDLDELAEINPALVRRMTPTRGSYQLAVPCGREQQTAELIAAIPPADRIRRFLHVVKSGDTPSSIARRYGSTVEILMAANNLRSPRSLRVGQTLVVPRSVAGITAARVRPARQVTVAAAAPRHPERYVVRRGDTLAKIARRFGTSADELRRANNLADTTIRPGEVLVLTR